MVRACPDDCGGAQIYHPSISSWTRLTRSMTQCDWAGGEFQPSILTVQRLFSIFAERLKNMEEDF
jgi:hypothetical protein